MPYVNGSAVGLTRASFSGPTAACHNPSTISYSRMGCTLPIITTGSYIGLSGGLSSSTTATSIFNVPVVLWFYTVPLSGWALAGAFHCTPPPLAYGCPFLHSPGFGIPQYFRSLSLQTLVVNILAPSLASSSITLTRWSACLVVFSCNASACLPSLSCCPAR